MNQELSNIIKIYSTGSHVELNNCLLGKSKDTLIGILIDLLKMYINDKNSSTIREFLTVTLAGYSHKGGKIGYNGFKQDVFVSGKTVRCEAKPKNCDTEEFEKYKRGERKSSPAKLNGGGRGFNSVEFRKKIGNYAGFHSLNFFQISNTIFSVTITLFLPILAFFRFPLDSAIKR